MNSANRRWEHFPHGADVGIRGIGTTLEEAFEQAGLALTAVMVPPDEVEPRRAVSVVCEAPDRELLLVDWLNAIVYEIATQQMLFGRFRVTIEGDKLTATMEGESLAGSGHTPAVEIKGATYTALSVTHRGGLWVAQCVVDV